MESGRGGDRYLSLGCVILHTPSRKSPSFACLLFPLFFKLRKSVLMGILELVNFVLVHVRENTLVTMRTTLGSEESPTEMAELRRFQLVLVTFLIPATTRGRGRRTIAFHLLQLLLRSLAVSKLAIRPLVALPILEELTLFNNMIEDKINLSKYI